VRSLLDIVQSAEADQRGWTPSPLEPIPGDVTELALDTETNGLLDNKKARIAGISYCLPDGTGRYHPFRHTNSGNLPEEQVLEWSRRELRGKRIYFANANFDIRMFRRDGIRLDEQGNSFADIQHYAALLDDSRRKFSLDVLSQEFLGEEKVGKDLDGSRMADYHPSMVEGRAVADASQTYRIARKLRERISKEDLDEVRELEEQVIPAVCEMEEQGAPLDTELLSKWVVEAERRYFWILEQIQRKFNMSFNPNRASDYEKLFAVLKIPVVSYTDKGNPSFKDEVLERVENPWIQLARYADHLDSLRSKFLNNYDNRVEPAGILRYNLHQLRSDEGGTITGRFSSSQVNIQQVMTLRNHKLRYATLDKLREWFPEFEELQSWNVDDFYVRKLFIPEDGRWLSADQEQVEYRIFAHYAKAEWIYEEYRKDPNVDFHTIVMHMIQKVKPSIDRKRTKDLNFAFIFGAGVGKIATMLNVSYGEAKSLNQAYKKMFPEADNLMSDASRLASRRGYVKTILGRRGRFPDKQNLHKALNKVIQGSAADSAKKKLIALHERRKETGFVMRFPVHDEINGDSPDQKCTEMVTQILNEQSIPFRVPILWKVETGSSWAEAK